MRKNLYSYSYSSIFIHSNIHLVLSEVMALIICACLPVIHKISFAVFAGEMRTVINKIVSAPVGGTAQDGAEVGGEADQGGLHTHREAQGRNQERI